MKKVAVLGSTGSVGTQTLDVIRNLNEFQVISLSAGKNIQLLEKQIREFKPKFICVEDEKDAKFLSDKFKDIKIFHGINGLCEIAKLKENDFVVNALAGFIGTYASISALNSGKTLLLANKESIVCGGSLLKGKILPLDSEHSAIWQCIDGREKFLDRIILTASGGPFFGMRKSDLKNVSIKQVLNHPTWKMGAKISVNSANMMNKGMEIIEASRLFSVGSDKIDVLIHPQSVVHSMVEFVDGNVFAQMSERSMKFPIQFALTYPERVNFSHGKLKLSNLSFYEPTDENNVILNLCRSVCDDTSMSCALNAVNEEAVDAFLCGKISFLDIENILLKGIDKFSPIKILNLDDVIETDRIGREIALNLLKEIY